MINNPYLVRRNETQVDIYWEQMGDSVEVTVFGGETPESIDLTNPLARVDRDTIVSLESIQRNYFMLKPADGQEIVVGERRVNARGNSNFRDLGGYTTVSGKRVKWGKIFRSDGMAKLTKADQELICQMGIRTVCDLRTHQERIASPDLLPAEGISYLHLPITEGDFHLRGAIDRIKKGEIDWVRPDFLVPVYQNYIDKWASVWGEIINRIAETRNIPLVFHCTGGKDRTGACAAIILLMLGIPEPTVIEDHQLSNLYIAPLLPHFYQKIRAQGVDPDVLAPFFEAPLVAIKALLARLKERSSSIDDYLITFAGVSPKTINTVKKRLLE